MNRLNILKIKIIDIEPKLVREVYSSSRKFSSESEMSKMDSVEVG